MSKKTILQPYTNFESQVKTIKQIIDEAVNHVRKQERQLVEKEREDKKKAIAQIFDKRIRHYDFEKLLGFADFIKPQHLNKSYSMTKVEKDLVDWLEKNKRNIDIIRQSDDYEDLIIAYQDTQDLSMSFEIVNKRKEREKKLSELETKKDVVNSHHVFTIEDNKDAQIVKLLLEQNNIEFKYKKY
ncbi:DUF1351 domain-containing protein [Staphylococcus sp. HMSC056G08]|uniref:DUF1351 domain-containing protein n=1 Tax=Staphylococcus sp. HMSC056G08 TaxID=1739350 RepID=UPI0008A33471|nr:DUF1351 domain-containing protein [Staphylococcus sp. HMSC056G08]OFJ77510.1 hypothetical protein HMPREF2846_09890 [Staphylococcus sp. HMSC056G08]